MREIVLDTETTGLDAQKGDRLIEIGCVEMVNRFVTGVNFHCYLNPDRAVHPDAFNVHGLSDAFLADKPRFGEKADEFLAFIGDDPLIIHNASFDIGFLNMELSRLKKPILQPDRVIDTLTLARRRHPGAQNSLDALCSRYGIDRSRRVKHGALLDSELLAEVYAELTGGKQSSLGLSTHATRASEALDIAESGLCLRKFETQLSRLTEEERDAHRAFIGEMGDKALWNAYFTKEEASQENLNASN